MKNIEQILKDAGVELTDEQKEAVNKGVTENYRTINDYNTQKKKLDDSESALETANKQLADAQETLKGFDGVDVDGFKKKIADLEEQAAKDKKEYAEKIAQRDFDDLLKSAISEVKGRNEKAIRANLDIENLMNSKNQKEDVKKALEALKGAEETAFMFVDEEAEAAKAAEEEAKQKAADGAPKWTSQSEGKPTNGDNKPTFNFGFTPIREVKKGD